MKWLSYPFMFLCLLSFGFACNNSDSGNYENNKQSLLKTENQNPLKFLTSQIESKINLLGDVVLDGKISNAATLAIYKDIKIHVDYMSKTNTVLGSDEQTIMEFIKPGESIDIKLKFPGYKGTKSVNFKIISASAETSN